MAVSLTRMIVSSYNKALIQHLQHGPPLPTWTLLFTTMVNLQRKLIGLGVNRLVEIREATSNLGPILPSNVTLKPHEIRVAPKKLKGILEDLSSNETNTRLIKGDWVYPITTPFHEMLRNKQAGLTSKFRLKTKQKIQQQKLVLEHEVQNRSKKVILYLHGGAYILMSAKTHRGITGSLVKHTGCTVLAIDYGLAPGNPFPQGLFDAVYAYLHLIDKDSGLGYDPNDVFVAGDSAGGGLALALCCYLRDNHYSMPKGIIALSPWVKPGEIPPYGSDTFDVLDLKTGDDNPIDLYKGDYAVDHPYITLVNADLNQLPPILVQYGNVEALRYQIEEFVTNVKQSSNTIIRSECYNEMVHVFHTSYFHPTSQSAFQKIHQFLHDVESGKLA